MSGVTPQRYPTNFVQDIEKMIVSHRVGTNRGNQVSCLCSVKGSHPLDISLLLRAECSVVMNENKILSELWQSTADSRSK